MRTYTFKSYFLGIFFITAVLIPAVALSFLAFRASNVEEVYLEKRLKNTLLAELTHTVSLVTAEIGLIQQELAQTAYVPEGNDFRDSFTQWRRRSMLVGTPFLLTMDHEIIWPDPRQGLTEKEQAFLNMNSQFFSDKKAIPVYQNIAVAYQQKIMDESLRQTVISSSSASAETQEAAYSGMAQQKYSDQQQAQVQFAENEPIRKDVYREARSKGQEVFYRKVAPQGLASSLELKKERTAPLQQESLFIAERLKFSQILDKADSGIIPRFVDDTLQLIFWKKDAGGYIVGCMVDAAVFRDRIVKVLPTVYTPVRVLTILDENSRPLIRPMVNNRLALDWRRPFISLEISELLPHWEIAAYLADPQGMASKARLTTSIIWLLILILFVSIAVGGTLVLRTLFSQMRLAQQKTTFVANVSHELKTPLTSIRLLAELLREKRQPDEAKQRTYLDIMVSETERLTRLINNVLDFARAEGGKKLYTVRPVDAVHICNEIVESQRVRLEHNGFEIAFVSEIKDAVIRMDEEALKQALVNLLSNAEKYSFDTKKIEVEVLKTGTDVLINIKDRGIGVPAAEAKNIFKEFYRVDDSLTAKVKGTGLGLTIALRIIRDHGGDILYLPREQGGSIFQIRLAIA